MNFHLRQMEKYIVSQTKFIYWLLICLSAIENVHCNENTIIVEANVGNNVKFVCPLETADPTDILWLFHPKGDEFPRIFSYGKISFSTKQNFLVDLNEKKLTVTAISYNDAGLYICRANMGQITDFQEFFLVIYDAPIFDYTVEERQVEVVEGHDAQIMCVVYNLRHYAIKWDFPETFESNSTFSISFVRNQYRSVSILTIFNIAYSAEGIYNCIVGTGIRFRVTLNIEDAPNFAYPLKNVTVPKGITYVLSCTATNLGKYQLQWYSKPDISQDKIAITHLANETIFSGDRITVQITISGISESDQMFYICVINTPTPMQQEKYVTVIEITDFGVSSEEIFEYEGETAHLDCYYDRDVYSEVYWSIAKSADLAIIGGSRSVVYDDQEDSLAKNTLSLFRINAQYHNKSFYCIPKSGGVANVGEASSTRIIIKRKPISLLHQSITANINGTVTLMCAKPTASNGQMNWFRDISWKTKTISIYNWMDRYEISNDYQELKIINLQFKDDAIYYGIMNEEVYCEIRINVIDYGRQTEFGVVETEVEAFEKYSIELKCRPGEYNLKQLRWKSGLGSLSHLKSYTIRYETDDIGPLTTLVIPQVIITDNSDSKSPSMEFICYVDAMTEDEAVTSSVSIKALTKPCIALKRVSVRANEGQNAKLPCLVQSIGKFNISWIRWSQNGSSIEDAEKLQESDKFSMKREGYDLFVLEIINITEPDMLYGCVVNTLPPDYTILALDFESSTEEVELEKKTIAGPTVKITKCLNRELNLSCVVNDTFLHTYGTSSVSVRWYEFNEFVTSPNLINKVFQNRSSVHGYSVRWDKNTGTLTLTIYSVTKSHAGLYICKVYKDILSKINDEPSYVQKFYLAVAVPPTLKIESKKVEFHLGQPLELNCSASNLGENDWIEWLKFINGSETKFSALNIRAASYHGGYSFDFVNGTSTLSRRINSKLDQGVYICRVFGYEHLYSRIDVTIKDIPEIFAHASVLYYLPGKGESVELACEYNTASETEEFSISWSKFYLETKHQLDDSGPEWLDFEISAHNEVSVLKIKNVDEFSEGIYICTLMGVENLELDWPLRQHLIVTSKMPAPNVVLTSLQHYKTRHPRETFLVVEFQPNFKINRQEEFVENFKIMLRQEKTSRYEEIGFIQNVVGSDVYKQTIDVSDFSYVENVYIKISAVLINNQDQDDSDEDFLSFTINRTPIPDSRATNEAFYP